MKRRDFSKKLIVGTGMLSVSSCSINKGFITKTSQNQLKPFRLQPGDTIGLIAPASSFDLDGYELAIKNIENLGFKVKVANNLFKKWGYLAGSDKERVDDLHQMFADPTVKGIWCIRGGYGVTRILHLLDYNLIKQHPKALIGYSDITALLHAIYIHTGLIGFHGPVAKSPQNAYNIEQFKQVVMQPSNNYTIPYVPTGIDEEYQLKVLAEGHAEGILSGGNLSLISAIVGTDNHWDATDKLVFLEDIEERPYRIDRMLTQLLQGANLAKAKGIILGVFRGCEKKNDNQNSLSLNEVLQDRLGNLGIPVFYGFSFGHINNICTIPIGINAKFDTSDPKIILQEAAVK